MFGTTYNKASATLLTICRSLPAKVFNYAVPRVTVAPLPKNVEEIKSLALFLLYLQKKDEVDVFKDAFESCRFQQNH